MCAVDEVQSVKTAVSHCDRACGKMTLMTLLLKCKARVITVLSLKAKAVTAEENTEQSGTVWWKPQEFTQNTAPTVQVSHVVTTNLSIRSVYLS